ncbi:MAG: prolyl oligopeptidase family serine peptidase [Devosia sp.]
MSVYPHARREEIVEVIGEAIISDPYRWLEEESAEALAFQAEQNRLSDHQLRDWPGFEALSDKVGRLTAPLTMVAPRQCAGKWFSLLHEDGSAFLRVSDSPEGSGRRFSLPFGGTAADRPATRVDWWLPSPDGRCVAYGVSEGGGAQGGIQLSRLGILDTGTGTPASRHIEHVAFGALAWLPDCSGFYYVAGLQNAAVNPERRLFFHRLGDDAPDRSEPLRGLSYCLPQVSPDGRHVVLVRGSREPRADLILDREGTAGWQLFMSGMRGACFGYLEDDCYVAITNVGADRGRVVAIPFATAADPDTWQEIVSESEGVLRYICRVGQRLVVCDLVDANARIRVFTREGQPDGVVPLPAEGAVADAASWAWWHYVGVTMVNAGDDTIAFVHSSFARSPVTYAYNLATKELRALSPAATELPGIVTTCIEAVADDGAGIPLKLVGREDLDPAQPHPTLIFAYGGYNHAFVPAYLAMFAAIVEAGGVLAFAHLRGGGEYGTAWWQAGHHDHKQRSFDDIYAVGDWLVREGRATTDRLGLVGASNGGMNVAVAVTQRPDLFKAAVALVPQCDLLRYGRDPFYGGRPIEGHHNGTHIHGGTWRDPAQGRTQAGGGFGTAMFPESVYPDPLDYSPYHAVRRGETYPATLIVSGSEDLWCPPWHGRKLVARLQAESAGSAPHLLRVWRGDGHDVPILGTAEQAAEWVGFLMRQLGLL